MDSPLFGRRERLAFVAGGLVMAGVVLAATLLALSNARDMAEAAHSQDVRATTVDLLEQVISAETGQRGYLLTGRADYLGPYREAVRRVPALLAALAPELGGDPDFRGLQRGVTQKMTELAHTVALVEAGRHDDAMALVRTDLGAELMLAIRASARRLTATERAVLDRDIARSRQGAAAVAIVDAAALAMLLALAGVIVAGARRYIAELRAAQAETLAANQELARGRERLEATVQERTADLRRANEEIQTFAYIVSHDLRAPLLNIIGFTSELEDAAGRMRGYVEERAAATGTEIPAPVREACERDLPEAIRFIQGSTAKMDRLINAILRLSREGRRVLVPERLDMAALLRTVIDSMRHQAEERGAEITLGAVPPLISDRLAVEQVFSNLIENAVKYLSPARPGRITVAGRREGSAAIFTVQDNGRGIAARDLGRVFELFRRAGTQNVPGEGIGLAHVRALVRRLGGRIDCSSELDVGTEFTLRLPAVLAHAEDAQR